MRGDLAPGLQAAQATHAAFDFAVQHPEVTQRWHEQSNYLVVVSCPDEDSLLSYADRLTGWCAPEQASVGIAFTLVHEPDIGEHTALAIAPSDFWKHLSDLPLAGKQLEAA